MEKTVEYVVVMPEEIIFDYDPEVTPTEWDAYVSLTDDEVDEWMSDNVRTKNTESLTWWRAENGFISYEHVQVFA